MEAMEQGAGLGTSLLMMLVYGLLIIVPTWRIFSRAGMAPAISLLVFIPGLGALIATCILAFARWPNSRD